MASPDTADASSQMDEVLYASDQGVATITLNRPNRMNMITRSMLNLLSKLLLQADTDPDIRVIVITANGRAFCAGLDLVGATTGTGIGSVVSSDQPSPTTIDVRSAVPTVLFNLEKPTICALNGAAAGYGMDMALGCDIRIMAEGAKLAAAFVKVGVLPESGGTWLLPRLIGWSKAAELIFTGRTLSAADSLELGLASSVVSGADLQAEARRLALEIAANAPLAVQAAKRMMRMGLEEGFNSHVHHVYLQLRPLLKSNDAREGMKAFLEKRPPQFKGQ